MKFQRTYQLKFRADRTQTDPDLVIAYPLTIKFNLTSTVLHSANQARFVIYNLGEKTRAFLYRDMFDFGAKPQAYVEFAAGYVGEPSVPTVFTGDVRQAFSYRQGPDWVTEIEAYDSHIAIQRSQSSFTISGPYKISDLIRRLGDTMTDHNVVLGTVSEFETERSRGRTFSGNTWDLMIKLMAQYQTQPFINKGVLHVVGQDEYIAQLGELSEISGDTGLLGTPRVSNSHVTANMIFEPRIEPGQQISVRTSEPGYTDRLKNYTNQKVFEVGHQGTISGAIGGDATTSVTFILAKQAVAA